MNAEEYFEEHHVPRHSKLIKGCGLLYQESEIPKLMEAYHQEQVKKLNIDDVSKQRELLIAYEKETFIYTIERTDEEIERKVDKYLSNL